MFNIDFPNTTSNFANFDGRTRITVTGKPYILRLKNRLYPDRLEKTSLIKRKTVKE